MEAKDGTNCQQCAAEEPRANALKHGLTASTYLPKILRPGRLPEIVASLRDEFRLETIPRSHDRCAPLFQHMLRELKPEGVTQQLLIAQMARSAVHAEQSAVSAIIWRRWATNAMADFAAGCESAPPGLDLPIRGLPSGLTNRDEQQVLVHIRAFHCALGLYLKLQKTSGAHSPSLKACQHFRDEDQCQKYLAHYQLRNFTCPSCGARKAYFVTMRLCLECADCHTQVGLRVNTVMVNSALSLRIWFRTVNLVLREPTISITRVGLILGLRRAATVRATIRKIRQALLSDDYSQLLAGLDEYYGQPEPSVSHLSQASLATKRTRAGAESDYPFIGPVVASTASQPTGSRNLSDVFHFLKFCNPYEKEKTMSDSLPQNLPGPEPEPAAEPQPKAQGKPQGKTPHRCHSLEECLALLSQLPLLLVSGLITPSGANALRGTIRDILAFHQGTGGPQAGPAVDQRLLQFLRTNPELTNLLAPFLSSEQAAQLLQEAANGNAQN